MLSLPWKWRKLVTISEPARTPRLRVLQYNILADHYCKMSDFYGVDYEWKTRLTKIVSHSLCCKPDVICLEEVDHWEDIKEAFSVHGYSGLYAKKALNKPDGVAILWNEQVEVLRQEKFLLEGDYMLAQGTRDQVALVLELSFGAEKTKCVLAATHLKSDHGGDNESVRLSQAMIMLERIEKFNNEGLPLIMAGDFNTVPTSDLYKLLRRKQIETAIGDVNNKKRRKLKHSLWLDSALFQWEQKEPDCTLKVESGFESTLDYIWYTPANLIPQEILTIPPSGEVPVHPSLEDPSDHLPVFCEFGFL